MGCWHHYGPYCDWPPPPEWSDIYRRHRWRAPWEPDEERPVERGLRQRRRGSRRDRVDRDEATGLATLESRARELREELVRIGSDIERLASRLDEENGG